MQIDYCLILSAGHGLRMGSIGKYWPKVLWPVFELVLIELQIKLARKWNVKHIFINLFYKADLIENYLKEKGLEREVTILKEKTLLDIGGAIYNLASHPNVCYQGNLLTLTSDQFLFPSDDELDNLKQIFKDEVSPLLLAIEVQTLGKHNQIIFDKNNRLIDIQKYNSQTMPLKYWTYSAVSLINLKYIRRLQGKFSFFESIANYKEDEVFVYPLKNANYWDFGTIERYCYSINKILNMLVRGENNDPMMKFLIDSNAINFDDLNYYTKSYRSKMKGTLEFIIKEGQSGQILKWNIAKDQVGFNYLPKKHVRPGII